jgi:TolB-like protein/class 3 adenylate cyclase/Flp pilus assembly protein TadD
VAEEEKAKLRLEIAHVLFIDIVGYSKLLIDEQSEVLQELNQIVRNTEAARAAQAAGQLIILPTGDGMALVFTGSVEDPVECALQISQALRAQPSLPVRMGIHSGPVHHVADVNNRENIAGAGINIAQRVMDCGDAGHILVSKRVADDLAQYRRWQPYLHELGDIEVKHGVVVSVVNLYADVVGNPAPPAKFKTVAAANRRSGSDSAAPDGKSKRGVPWHEVVIALLLFGALIAAGVFFFRYRASENITAISGSPRPAAAAIPEKSVAVLPFENLSEEKANAFFTDGVQDQILTNLANIADLKVISRTSVMQYKTGAQRNLREIGQQLGVAHLLEGSVQRAANKVRVTAQLINARTDAHLWAQTYDRDLADVFAIQSEIAKNIADQLRAKILPREKRAIEEKPTKDIAAYDLYIRATEEVAAAPDSQNPKEHLLHAIGLLDQAIARDPTFFNAYCKQVRAHDQLYLFGEDHTPARLSLAQKAVDAALRLQPDAGEAHLALALHLYSKLDYDAARKELETARRGLPNDPGIFELSGYIDRRQGRWQEATRNLERALELDPNNVYILNQTATSYLALREYDKQAATLDRILVLKPNDLDTRLLRAQVEVFWKADPRPMHQVMEAAIRENPAIAVSLAPSRIFLATAERDPVAGERAVADLGQNTYGPDAIRYTRAFGEGFFARLKGDPVGAQAAFTKARAEQQQIVNAQPDYGPVLIVLGLIDAQLGRNEDALREGRRAVELMPPSKDSINGAHIMQLLGVLYVWVGEKNLAIEQLSQNARIPSGVHYGQLRLWPQWDEVRGDPRFEKIVDSLAPKEAK